MTKQTKRFIIICLCLIFTLGLTGTSPAAPKKLATAKAGDCAACHGKDKVLPDDHAPTKNMPYSACTACHKKDGAAKPLVGKMPLSHIHQLKGVTCAKCHGKGKAYKEVKMPQCISCHGDTDKLAEKTAQVKPENPHKSPHYGTQLDCNLCHHQHSKSENFCASCHKFDYIVP